MRTTTTRIAGASFVAAAALALSVGPAFAADGFVSANLKPVAGNGVNGSGTAMVEVKGNQITVDDGRQRPAPRQPARRAHPLRRCGPSRVPRPVRRQERRRPPQHDRGRPRLRRHRRLADEDRRHEPEVGPRHRPLRHRTRRQAHLPAREHHGLRATSPRRSPPESPSSSSTASTTTRTASTPATRRATSCPRCPPRPPTRPCVARCASRPRAACTPVAASPLTVSRAQRRQAGQNEALMLVGGAALLAAAGTGVFAARRARTRA